MLIINNGRLDSKLIFSDHVQMAMLTLAGAVPGLEVAEGIFTWTTYNALAQSTNLRTVPMIMIQVSMINTMKIGVWLVGMVTIYAIISTGIHICMYSTCHTSMSPSCLHLQYL